MENTLCREILAARLLDERAARALGQAGVAEALENTGVRADAERARTRRERVARFLKALAYRLVPSAGYAERATNAMITVP